MSRTHVQLHSAFVRLIIPTAFAFSATAAGLIVLGAEYLSYVKFIATYALTFLGYIISVLVSVLNVASKITKVKSS